MLLNPWLISLGNLTLQVLRQYTQVNKKVLVTIHMTFVKNRKSRESSVNQPDEFGEFYKPGPEHPSIADERNQSA